MIQRIRTITRKLLNAFLRPFDVEVYRRALIQRASRSTYRGGLEHLKNMGFNPATVIDVGVGYGTHELYDAFPNARHELIEPLDEARESIENLARRYPRMEYTLAAAAGKAGTTTINVHPDIARSSVYWESDYDRNVITPRKVRAVTIDQIFHEKKLRGPLLLKIDVQGAEIDVMRGAKQALRQTECIVLETSLYEFFKGGPQISDVIGYMNKIGFVVFDIWALQYRKDGTLLMVDIAFVKKKGSLRGQHKFHPNGF